MAKAILCDGCGNSIIGELHTLGIALKRDYCKPCFDIAEEFQKEEEAIRAMLYNNFVAKRGMLIDQYGVDYFLLPDVSDPEDKDA